MSQSTLWSTPSFTSYVHFAVSHDTLNRPKRTPVSAGLRGTWVNFRNGQGEMKVGVWLILPVIVASFTA